MNQTEIDELRRLHEAATPGDWEATGWEAGSHGHKHDTCCIAVKGSQTFLTGNIPETPRRRATHKFIAAARNALPRLLAALEEARAERDKANGLVKRMEHDNRVIARELDCSWGGSANPEHECKEDNPCLLRQYQDAEERLEATATFLERATTRQCYLAKQAAEAERDALKATLAKHAESERAWCELAKARGEKLAALATACSTWQEWGGHCDTCEFVRQRAANPILDTALFADYCDCGWHATREALAAAKVQP